MDITLSLKFNLTDLRMLEPVGQTHWQPVGEFFIYQKGFLDYQWWSYDLFKLKEIAKKNGGLVLNSKGEAIFMN